jgi:Secretion system C-terminal sorting domain/Carboxylesterase family
MRKITLTLLSTAMITLLSHAQTACFGGRYASNVFSNYTQTNNISFGQNTTWSGANQNLTMDFFEPTGDTASIRPLIIWAHGGSFLTGTSADIDVATLSQRFAKKGFACASINYRLGFFPIDSANAVKAVLRAVQDMKAAVRFFYKDRKTGTNAYRIDTNHIFIGGSSAGAITSLHYAYMDSSCEVNPYLNQTTLVGLGGTEGNSGNPCYSTKVHGVINLCGALARYWWMKPGAPGTPPLCSIHGTTDGTVKYNRGVVNPGTPLMYLDGSRMLYEWEQSQGVNSHFYTFLGAGHVPYAGTGATQLAYMDTTEKFIRDFLIQQLGCTDPILQPANNPAQTASLYPYTLCNTHSTPNYCSGVGFQEYTQELIQEIFPNPSGDIVNIRFAAENSAHSIELYDISGRMVKKYHTDENVMRIEKADLPQGIYTLKVSNENQDISLSKIIFY